MKIRIGDRIIPAVTQDDATLADLLAIKTATGLTKKDLREIGERVAGMTEQEAEDSEDALLLTGIMIWLSRRHAGDRLSLEEACDFPLAQLELIPEPGDDLAALAGEGDAVDPLPAGETRRSEPRSTRPVPADRLSKKKTSKKP